MPFVDVIVMAEMAPKDSEPLSGQLRPDRILLREIRKPLHRLGDLGPANTRKSVDCFNRAGNIFQIKVDSFRQCRSWRIPWMYFEWIEHT